MVLVLIKFHHGFIDLQSHASPLGTARPTHYHILLNEANFPVDAIQTLTYKLCHLSVRYAKHFKKDR